MLQIFIMQFGKGPRDGVSIVPYKWGEGCGKQYYSFPRRDEGIAPDKSIIFQIIPFIANY